MSPCRVLGVAISILAMPHLSLRAIQPVAEQLIQGEGVNVTVRTLGPVPRPRFALVIQRAGLPEDLKQVDLHPETAAVRDVRIHRGPLIAVVSQRRDRDASIMLVDGRSGAALFERTCKSVRLTDDRNNYVCAGADGIDWAFNLTRRKAHKIIGEVDGALKVLASGSINSRLTLLKTYRRSVQMWESPSLRDALIAELRSQVQADRKAASEASTAIGYRVHTPSRQYLGELIRTARQLGATAILEIVAEADHDEASVAVMAGGPRAVPVIIAALAKPTPFGYSRHYRASRLLTLLLIVQEFDVGGVEVQQSLAPILAATFERPADWAEILHAMRLAAELDLDAFDSQIRQFGTDAGTLRALGIVDETAITTIQNAARQLLLRRSAPTPSG